MQKVFKRIASFGLAVAMCLGITAALRVTAAESTVVAEAATDYYAPITAQGGTRLLGQLHDLITTTHTTYTSYEDCKNYGPVTDPGLDGRGALEFYTHETIMSFSGNLGTWNREHVWCKSLSNGMWKSVSSSTRNGGTDMHHIRPSEGGLNSTRGSNKYGEVNGGKEAWSRTSGGGNSKLGGYIANGTFEPLDNVKGDVARIVMYVYTHYNTAKNVGGTTNGTGSGFGTLNFTHIMTASSEDAAKKLLLDWNRSDPVDEIERYRNEEVYKIQGNRNPFIDNSSYADAIWGSGSVTPPETVELQSLSLNATSLTLEKGRAYNLTVTPNPANAPSSVTWSSSNSSVATVSNGSVMAKGEGVATITATSTVKPSVKASATVIVIPASVPDGDELTGTFIIAVDLTAAADIGKFLYFNGEMAQNYYFGTTEDEANAAEVVVEKVGDGYTFETGGKYIEVLKSGNYVNVALKDSPSGTWNYNSDVNTFTWRINATGTDYYLGTRTNNGKTYTTISASDIKYITGDNAQNVGVTQFIVDFVKPGGAVNPPQSEIKIMNELDRLCPGDWYHMRVTDSDGEEIPNSDIVWKSSDSSVAYVDDSYYITAESEGVCTIMASLRDNPAIYTTARVTVARVFAYINQDDFVMSKGDEDTLSVDFYPYPREVDVTWSSSNPEVATVDQNGKVTAVGKGTCEIKIVSKENQYVTDSVTLTVNDGTTQDSANVTAFKTALAKIANITEDDSLEDLHAMLTDAIKAYNKLDVSEKALVTTESAALNSVISAYNAVVDAVNSSADEADNWALTGSGSFFKWVDVFLKAIRGE